MLTTLNSVGSKKFVVWSHSVLSFCSYFLKIRKRDLGVVKEAGTTYGNISFLGTLIGRS